MLESSTSQALGTVLGLVLAAPVQAAVLFEPASPRAGAPIASADTQRVRVNDTALRAASLEFEVDGQPVVAHLSHREALPDRVITWSGHIRGATDSGQRSESDSDSLTLVQTDKGMTGSIQLAGQHYLLLPGPGGQHVLQKTSGRAIPPDHPPESALVPVFAMPVPFADGAARGGDSQAPVTLRVLVAASRDAAIRHGERLEGLARLAIAESNQGYRDSGIGIVLELAGFSALPYMESGSFVTDLQRFRLPSDGYMDDIHASRDRVRADVGMLMLANTQYCGLASGIGSTAATAFAAVSTTCAAGYFSFAHEIGHLQGARHNVAADPSTRPYAHGHGFQHRPAGGAGWRTIMSYDCRPACPRLNAWSNPMMYRDGVPMGDPHSADNHRVLQDTREVLAGFR